MLYIFGKYYNQRVTWAVLYTTDNTIRCTSSSFMM